MSRLFTAASSQYLIQDSASFTSLPYSFACYFQAATLGSDVALIWLGDKDQSNTYFAMALSASSQLSIVARTGSGTFSASSAASLSTGVWYHGLVSIASATDQRVFVNGADKATQTSSSAPYSAIDRMGFGSYRDTTPDRYFDGLMAQPAFWNVALTDADAAALGAGVSPLLIRSQNLIKYYPYFGRDAADIDVISGGTLTNFGATTGNDEPRVLEPYGRRYFKYSSAAAPALSSVSVTGATATTFTIALTTDRLATVVDAGYPKDTTTPLVAAVKAGTGAHGTNAASIDGANSISLTVTDTPPYPIYDLYLVGSNVTGDSSLSSILDQMLAPPAGYQFITAPAGPYATESIFDAETEAGNIAVVPTTWAPSGNALSLTPGGVPYSVSAFTGRQTFTFREYDVATKTWVVTPAVDGYSTPYYLQNVYPQWTVIPAQSWFAHIAIDPVILNDYCTDPEGDGLTFSATLPAGLSIALHTYNAGQPNERTVYQIEGTPTTAGSGSISNLQANDGIGGLTTAAAFAYVIAATAQVPDIDDGDVTLSDGTASLGAVGLTLSIGYQLSAYPVGNITAVNPAPGTWVPLGTAVAVTVSGSIEPTGFTFAAQTGVALSTEVTSAPVTVLGITQEAPIFSSGGTYSINDGPYVSTTGQVDLGDIVRARVISSGQYETQSSVTVTIGTTSSVFSVTTLVEPDTPDIVAVFRTYLRVSPL